MTGDDLSLRGVAGYLPFLKTSGIVQLCGIDCLPGPKYRPGTWTKQS